MNCKGISEVSHSISWTSPAGRGQDAHVWFPALLGVLARAMRAGVWSEDKLGEAGLSFHCRFQGPGAGVQAVSTLTCRAISPPPWSGFLRQDPASLSCSVWLSVSLLRCLFAGTLVIILRRDIVSQLSRLPPRVTSLPLLFWALLGLDFCPVGKSWDQCPHLFPAWIRLELSR